MNKLTISNFKAFGDELSISLTDGNNLLLYGENGSGKSSLYEAIRVVFFKDRVELGITANTPEEEVQRRNEIWDSFNNRTSNLSFNIKINDVDWSLFEVEDYQVFMISMEEMTIDDKLNLQDLLSTFCLMISDVPTFCMDNYNSIQEDVNIALASFKETVKIEIDEQDDFVIKIIDQQKNIERKSAIKKYFNEAKLNLITLLILFTAILKSKDNNKQRILVLDDFITSLDVSNRTFLVNYILANFQDSQLLIFTHNISFYNLIMHIVKDIDYSSSKWEFGNLYEINNIHKLYLKSERETVKDIKDAFTSLSSSSNPLDFESIGNRVRKKFEVLLYEYSKLLMIGAVEDSKNILAKIMRGEGTYFDRGHTASDLLNKIQQILNENNSNNLIARLQTEIDKFKYEPFHNFQKILNELKLYQKVTMHPLSHGINGINNFTFKEIDKSIDLLEKMETYIKGLVDSNVAAV